MKRNEAIELLEKYNDFLHSEGYVDSDIYSDRPTALDGFFGTKWAKENLNLCDHKGFASSQKTPKGTYYFCRRCKATLSFIEFMVLNSVVIEQTI